MTSNVLRMFSLVEAGLVASRDNK